MTNGGGLPIGYVALAVSFLLPFAVCFALARRGHARTALWLPGGIFVMTGIFVWLGMQLGDEIQTGLVAVRSIATISAASILGALAGILLGRRRT
jgi:hypothetical protein